jgi:Flp pilus assembly protein TadG
MKIKSRANSGQVMAPLMIIMIFLVGAIGLGADVSVLYLNWVILQKGVDAAALAGAGYLQSDSQAAPTAISIAVSYAEKNGIRDAELQTDGSGNKAYVPGPNYSTITITATRTVPYAFLRLLGLNSGVVSATATAQMPQAPGCVNCTSAVPTPGSQPTVTPGNSCSSVGQCGVVPIGIDYSTPYTLDQPVTLNFEQVGPGNWDNLALGATGGSNLRSNIADGYQGPLAVGQWVDTEPGKKTGPVNQGFSDRLTLAQDDYSSDTFLNHSPANPQVIIVPMVNWNNPNGRSQVEIMAFAALWVGSVSGGTINAHFIDQESFDSTGSAAAPFRGARGRPILIK